MLLVFMGTLNVHPQLTLLQGFSRMLYACFGTGIFSKPEDPTYAGNIYAQLSIKEFVYVPVEDCVETVDLITGLGDSSTAIADWNDAAVVLWGYTSSPHISLPL